MRKERKTTNQKIVVGGMLLVIIVTVAIFGIYNNIKNINNVNNVKHKQATTNVEGENIEEQSEENEGSTNEQSESPQLIFARTIGGNENDVVNSVIETIDGGYLVGGYFTGTVDLGKGKTLNSNGGTDSMIIKYDEFGRVEWARQIGGTNKKNISNIEHKEGLYLIEKTKDEGYIVGANANSINLENEETLNGNGESDGMVIRYNKDGKIKWAKQ